MSFDKIQYRELIDKVLHYLEPEIPYSLSARELLMLTMAVESEGGKYLQQVGGGPARGPFQMEHVTENDIWDTFLAYRPKLAEKVKKLMDSLDESDDMVTNDWYAIAMARIKYKRIPFPLPSFNDVEAMAQYHLKYYNAGGKATIQHSMDCYKKYCI